MSCVLRRCAASTLVAGLSLFPTVIPGGAQAIGGIRGFAPVRVQMEKQLEEKLRSIPDATHAENNSRRLTSEPHMAGTEASRRVAEWLRDQYRSFGFDVEIVSYNVWLPEPREVKLELTRPAHKSLASPEQPFEGDKATYDERAAIGFSRSDRAGCLRELWHPG
jgi:N-acetylated-alpha-linked acidic dipeptidase